MRHSESGALRDHILILAILLLAFGVQFYGLGTRTFHGDEIGSLFDAGDLSRNAHAISFFALLRLWMVGGTSEFWLRSLSAFSIVLAVAALFAAVRRFWNRPVALVAAALLATSPFAEVYAQQVRFYSTFLLAACFSLWAFASYLARSGRRQLILLVIANLFLLTTHVMSVLFVLSQALAYFLLIDRFSRKSKILVLGAMAASFALVLLLPETRALGFNALAAFVNDPSTYSSSRGLSIVQVVKIPLTLFFFTFGESLYPLTYIVLIPGVLIFGMAFVVGLWRLQKCHTALTLTIVSGTLSLVLLYLVFDSLTPAKFEGAAPRYVIFLLPLFYLIVAAGAQGKRKWLIVPLILVNLGSLVFYWYGDWAYNDDLVNWRSVRQWAENNVTPQTVVLLDGRAGGMAQVYFPSQWVTEGQWDYQQSSKDMDNLTKFSRIVFLSGDFHQDRRMNASALIREIEKSFDRTSVWSKYPLFIYVYDRKPSPTNAYRVDSMTGGVSLPDEIFGLEFQDMRLPIDVRLDGRPLQITGAFGLPTLSKQLDQTIPLNPPTLAHKIVLLSNLTGAGTLPASTQIAMLRVQSADGAVQEFPLRVGYETSDWDKSCQPAACKPIYSWRKRLALLGSQAYPGNWQEFEASIFAVELSLDQPNVIRALEFQRAASPGTFNVWGILLEQ